MLYNGVLVSAVYKVNQLYILAPFIEEAVFSLLCTLASFVKDKVTICAWVYLWAFYPVPLVYISVFVPVPNWLDYCSSVV